MRALVLIALLACDDRAALHEPDPTFARMLSQRRADAYEGTKAFADGKVMRRPPVGTVAVEDDSDAPPPPLSRALIERGRARFDAICSVCHGVDGMGDSVVATKMTLRPPPSLIDDERRSRTREQLFRVVTDGYGLMSSYADVLSSDERWAVVSYVQALQLSRHAPAGRLPASIRERLTQEAR